MKKIIISALIFLAAALILLFAYSLINQNALSNQTSYAVKATPITYENIEDVLSGNNIVKVLPEDAQMILRFYNFNTGSRVWEKSYTLKKGSVKKGASANPDISLSMHSKYFNELTDQNLCSTIKKAKNNDDLGVEIYISQAALLWKYRSILKYKECFGL